jgi:curli production assembly/transport component CsgG
MGTKLLESETGYSVNEPVNYAVRAAIEAGIVALIYEGETKSLWKFKEVEEIEITELDSEVIKEVDISLPKIRPVPLNEALEKWPNERLACSAKNLCTPLEPEIRP